MGRHRSVQSISIEEQMSKVQQLELTKIRIDGDTQSRVELNHETVEDYSEAMAEGAQFPPVTVFFDGASYWLTDGFHRYFGADHAGIESIAAEVYTGTKLDAQLFSFGVNASHGLRRTNEDKRKAVIGALKHPVSGKWSDRQIAKHCGVGHQLVGQARRSLDDSSSDAPAERTYTTKHGTTAVMNTANIGKTQPAANPAPAAPVAAPVATQAPAKPAPAKPAQVVEPEAEAPPDYTELDAAYDQISELQAELVVARMGDVTEEQKAQAAEHIAELNAEIKTLRASLAAVTLSRDSLMEERAQMMRQMKAQRSEIERLKSNK